MTAQSGYAPNQILTVADASEGTEVVQWDNCVNQDELQFKISREMGMTGLRGVIDTWKGTPSAAWISR